MAKQFLFVDAQGDYTESAGAYEQADYLASSVGVGDAGKPIVLDATGKLDPSIIDDTDIDHNSLTNTHNLTTDIDHDQLTNFLQTEHFTEASIDHGSIAGLGDDDHTIYTLADGTRDFSAVVSYDTAKTFTLDAELVDKKYVDDSIASSGTSAEWQDSVIDKDLTAPPGTPATGDRYLIGLDTSASVATGAWAGKDGQIAEYDGATWLFTVPVTGTFVSADDETGGLYYFGGITWTFKEFEATTASLGCEKVGLDIRLDLLLNGGLKLTGSEVGIEPDDFAGAGLIDDGVDNMAIDWSTTFTDAKAIKAEDINSIANGEGASIVGIEDTGAYYTSANVEGALAEIGLDISSGLGGVEYTVGVGGVTKGQLLYVSANNTVLPYTNITVAQACIGLADSTQIASATVKSLSNDTVLEGVLTGATAGTKYFWDGSNGWVTSLAGFSSGEYIYLGGVAKNTTDIHTEVAFIKRKS